VPLSKALAEDCDSVGHRRRSLSRPRVYTLSVFCPSSPGGHASERVAMLSRYGHFDQYSREFAQMPKNATVLCVF